MKTFSYFFCVLLVLFFVNALPTDEFSTSGKEKRSQGRSINDIDAELQLKDLNSPGIIGSKKEYRNICGTETSLFDEYFIKILKPGEEIKSYINTKSSFYICKDTNEYPVIRRHKLKYRTKYFRYRDKYQRNILNVSSCPGNEYLVVKCKKK